MDLAGQSREVAAAIIQGRHDGSWAPRVGMEVGMVRKGQILDVF